MKSLTAIPFFKVVLSTLLIVAIIGELVFYPSLPNVLGCLMALTGLIIFFHFFQRKYVLKYPFAFIMFFSMFCYRYLPLILTFVEGKPISYRLQNPSETFFYEMLLFCISAVAFYFGTEGTKTLKNKPLFNLLTKFDFYTLTAKQIWFIGFIGFSTRILNLGNQTVDHGDVGSKFLLGLDYLQYAPLILLFPTLINLKHDKKVHIWLYVLLIFTVNIASNSRRQMLVPLGTIALLSLLYLIKKNISIGQIVTPLRLLVLLFAFSFINYFVGSISLAMLHNRTNRDTVTKVELFSSTIETLQDESLMESLYIKNQNQNQNELVYESGWSESYIDNFMFNRYANISISDRTIRLAEKKGFMNAGMLNLFGDNLLSLIPTPFIAALDINLNKSDIYFSRGDYLFGSGLGGYKVTSHIGDGLATFGYFYFLIQGIILVIVFKLLNTFVHISSSGNVTYAPFGLASIFVFLGMFRNAHGVIDDFGYVLRGYWQGLFTFFLVLSLANFLIWLISKI